MNEVVMTNSQDHYSAYLSFTRSQWKHYRDNTPLTLSESDLDQLQGQNEPVSLTEVTDIYLPLTRLLNFYVRATQALYQATSQFLGSDEKRVPYIIGIAGSVAVGKSTTSRVLQALLSRWPHHPTVQIVTTDGFLYPNATLEARDLMHRKGFPDSYDLIGLIRFLNDLKSGKPLVSAPVYSHHHYDIVPNQQIELRQPDIVIVEGLNILQSSLPNVEQQPQVFVSDFFDFTIFVDAEINVIKQWYIERLLSFWHGSFRKKDAYFHHLTELNHEEVIKFATRVWHEINENNYFENILPFRQRARLILQKDQRHCVSQVYLRKL